MIQITLGKGFRMTFANGWQVSVQFGPDNYCANRSMAMHKYPIEPDKDGFYGCPNAEVAVWDADGQSVRLTSSDTVEGHMSPDKIAALLFAVANGVLKPGIKYDFSGAEDYHGENWSVANK